MLVGGGESQFPDPHRDYTGASIRSRSPFPTSSSIIPDGEISPVRLEAKTFVHGACPSHAQFKRWCACTTLPVRFASCLVRLDGRRFSGHCVPVGPSAPDRLRPGLLYSRGITLLHRYYEPMRRSRCLSSSFRAPHLEDALAACTINGWSSGPSRFGLSFCPGVLRPLYRRFDGCT